VTLPFNTSARSSRAGWPARAAWLLLAALSTSASAQGPAPAPAPAVAEVAESDALILQGLKLREQGKDAEALQLFVRAQELAPTPRALAQRALAEQALGNWVQAEIHLSQALADTDDPWITHHRQALDAAFAVIGEHLGYLQINGGVAGAELRLDGQLAGTLPLPAPLRVVTGRPLLEVTLAGYYPVRREVSIKAGSLSTEAIELVPAPVQQPANTHVATASHGASAQASTSDASSSRTLPPVVFWAGAGVTAVLGGITVWSGLNTSAKNDAYEDYAREPDATSDQALRGYNDATSAQTRTNALLVGTGVAAAATIAIGVFFTDWDGPGPSAEQAPVAIYSDGVEHGLVLHRRF
jgi:tetratricopeptide (TPR) repeat protein